jgi:hypothetical protein
MSVRACAAAAFLVALSSTGRAQSVPAVVDTSDGPRSLVGADIGWFTDGAISIELGTSATAQGNAQIETVDCRRELNLELLGGAATKIIRDHRLGLAHRSVADGQLILMTTPKIDRARATFYSFAAAMEPCAGRCSLNVRAWKVVAPHGSGTIDLRSARKENDEITGALVDAGEAEFHKCRRTR